MARLLDTERRCINTRHLNLCFVRRPIDEQVYDVGPESRRVWDRYGHTSSNLVSLIGVKEEQFPDLSSPRKRLESE
jgi:hypothetical protein